MELDDTVCYCFHISKRKIVNFIRINKPRRASQLTDCGGAGTGCGWCVNYLKRSFAESRSPTVLDEITPAEYAQQRAAYIKAGHGKPAAGAIPLPAESPPDPGQASSGTV